MGCNGTETLLTCNWWHFSGSLFFIHMSLYSSTCVYGGGREGGSLSPLLSILICIYNHYFYIWTGVIELFLCTLLQIWLLGSPSVTYFIQLTVQSADQIFTALHIDRYLSYWEDDTVQGWLVHFDLWKNEGFCPPDLKHLSYSTSIERWAVQGSEDLI